MPSKKKKYNARFPPARIKKIMQTDEDVGKVAAAVPVIISRALEMFIETLIVKSSDTTKSRHSKTLSTAHIKHTIQSEKRFDFLTDLVSNIADVQGDEDGADDVPTTSAESEHKTRGRPRKKNASGEEGSDKQYSKRPKLEEQDPDTEETDSATEEPGSEDDEEDDEEDEKEENDSNSLHISVLPIVKTETSYQPQTCGHLDIQPQTCKEDNDSSVGNSTALSDGKSLDLRTKWSATSSSEQPRQSHDTIESGQLQQPQIDINHEMSTLNDEQNNDTNKTSIMTQDREIDSKPQLHQSEPSPTFVAVRKNASNIEAASAWKGRVDQQNMNNSITHNEKTNASCQNQHSNSPYPESSSNAKSSLTLEKYQGEAQHNMARAESGLHPHSIFANMSSVMPQFYPHPGLIPPIGPFPQHPETGNYVMSPLPQGMMPCPPMALHHPMLNTPINLMQHYPPLQRMLDPRCQLPEFTCPPHMAASGLSGQTTGPPPAHTKPDASSILDKPYHANS